MYFRQYYIKLHYFLLFFKTGKSDPVKNIIKAREAGFERVVCFILFEQLRDQIIEKVKKVNPRRSEKNFFSIDKGYLIDFLHNLLKTYKNENPLTNFKYLYKI